MATSDNHSAQASGIFRIGDDLPVQRLGFGAMRLTGKGIWGEPADVEACRATLRRAVELGVTLIDTADSYGPEVSENLIAATLAPFPSDVVIATKGGLVRSGPDKWDAIGRPEYLRAALEGSLRRLKLDHIDLYQFHRPDPRTPFEESVGAFAAFRQEGKIRHVGLSNVTVAEIETARRIVPIVTVQNRYNLTDRASEDVLDYCTREGIGFIPWFPLATGNLAKPGSVLDQIAQRLQAAPSQVALAWLLHRSPIVLPIPGTASVSHLEENIAAAALKLSDADMAALAQAVA
ncbi:MAG: aldo/keto reductase [Ktedonobacterales bacterium]|nr:aldo/keto reductase [Ktedonobacterales bacterium]